MMADDLNKIKEAFGISALIVEHNGDVILQSGEFQSVRAGVDGTLRPVRSRW